MIKLQNKTNVSAPNATYPYGNIKDDTGSDDGTPLNEIVHADFHQFFAKMFDAAEGAGLIVSNNLPENDDNGYQYYTALLMAARAANKTLISVLAESIIGRNLSVPLSPSVPYALMGLNDSGSAISTGYIYFGGTVYRCFGLAYGTVVHSLQLNPTVSGGVTVENLLTMTDTATPGLFAYTSVVFIQTGTPKIVIHRTTSESATSISAVLKFTTAVSNLEGWYNPATGKFTPQKAGFYQLNTKAMFAIGASLSGFEIELSVYKNGVQLEILHQEFDYTGGGNKANCQGDYIVSANGTTDYFEVHMALTSSQAWSMIGHLTWKFLPNC